jgi:F0F1-type ATP synthase membrane subunit b/b'
MKKLAAGCLVVAVIALVSLGVAIYFGYRAVSPMIDSAQAVLQQAKDAAEESDRIENKTAYTPPADHELTEAQLRRFLAVHERTRKALGPNWDDLRAQADRIEQQAKQDARELSFTEVVTMVRALGSVIVDARRAHVDALNAEQFSASEYAWVKLRAYEAAGLEVMEGIDWSAIQEAVKDGAGRIGVPEPTVPRPEVPARNRELVKPHIEELKAWLPLTVLGL